MIKLNTALRLPWLITCSMVLLAILLASCNLREDILLPPNLDPKDYIMANRIQVYADHLIRSENDDSYLYLPKASISDSLIWYGDEITIKRVEHLLDRNNLALAEGSTKLSDSYQVLVKRNGEYISLLRSEAFATVYTDLSGSNLPGKASLISWEYLLAAEDISIYPYGKKRAFFEIDGTGIFALAKLSNSRQLVIQESETQVQGLLKDGDTSLQVFIPAEFTSAMGLSVFTLKDALNASQSQTATELYPGFAMLTKVLQVTTTRTGISSSTPIIHYTLPSDKLLGKHWLKLDEDRLDSWAESESTWKIQDDTLITFVNGAGSYFLLEPLAEQNTLRISLDGSYRQVYLPDMWLDLKDAIQPGIDLEIVANPSTTELMQDYFNLRPYVHYGQLQAYQIKFLAGAESLQTLADGQWLEFGFPTTLQNFTDTRLMRVYRDPGQDIITYKTHAEAYDDTHFSTDENYVYTGINSSGTYLFGKISEHSGTQQIPCLKTQLYLQMDKTTLSYQDSNPPCTAIRLGYNDSVPGGHAWMNSLPYFLINSESYMQIVPIGGNSDALPAGLFLQTKVSGKPESVINFSPQVNYPKFIRYRKSGVLAHNSFLFSNGILSISPAYAGYLIDGQKFLEIGAMRDLAMYPKMVFDDYDVEIYLDSASAMSPSTLRIAKDSELSDPFNVLQQYQLSYLSPSYTFSMLNNTGFYGKFQPYIRIKEPTRSKDLLFSVSNEEYYRIYSYPEGEEADGWHFMHRDGHYAFYLPYDAEYAVMRDNAPHSSSEIILSQVQDIHLSLYQAQASIPQAYIGSSLALGSRLSLTQVASVAAGVTFRAAYRINMLGPQQNPLQPNFFSQPNPDWPYLYIPIPNYAAGQSVGAFYRDLQGNTQVLNRVESFSETPGDEFIVLGNCAVAFINNPGYFYVE